MKKLLSRRILLTLACLLGLALAATAVCYWISARHPSSNPSRPLTFSKDIAPIVFQNCAPCHHPGQSAPFDLLTYDDVKKRARDIAKVTASHYMPPWLPDSADGPFVGQRSLSPDQIALIQRWVTSGTPEGQASDMPPVPQWRDGWELGKPDLVIQMPEPFALAATGPDIYRNFVIAIPNTSRRYVRGIELQPGNPRIIHHAFMRIDATPESRRRDEQEPAPGFGGLHTPASAQTPAGQFLSWQPGKRHTLAPPGLAWNLETNCDLVLQTHLRPSGKPETLQASIGFYFTEDPPTNTPFKIGLRTFVIVIPEGSREATARESYTLAADVEVLSVLPHAHYLGKSLEAVATLPNGREQRLLHIGDWDFNWQGDYLFQKPVFLPQGTKLSMLWRYDNTGDNPRNPNQPPRTVHYGLQSNDEMAELWLQVLPRRTNDLAALARYDQPRVFRDAIAFNQYLLGLDPNDARAHTEIGKAQLFLGQYAAAAPSLSRAIALDAALDEPHYFLGLSFRIQNQLQAAMSEFSRAIQLNPSNAKAHGNLGLILFDSGNSAEAEPHLREALRLNPRDDIARETLEQIAKGKTPLQ